MVKLDTNKLLSLYPEYDSVLGPYTRKDGRKHVVLNNSKLNRGHTGKLKTISFPKALVESSRGERLSKEDTVDHKDRDFENDSMDNFNILNKSDHGFEDVTRVKVDSVNCLMCGKEFIPTRNQIDKRSIELAGPFCSRKCSGEYGSYVQNGGKKKPRVNIVKTYYQNEK